MSKRARDLKVVNKDTKEVQHDLGIEGGVFDMMELEKELKLAEEVNTRLEKIIGDALNAPKAKYKLEVYFPRERLRDRAYPGFVSFWSSAGFAHGGGDHNVYLCTAKISRDGNETTCARPIDLRFVNSEIAICEHCKTVISPENLCGQIFARLTTNYWVALILKVFRRLESDADINLTFVDSQLRQATNSELKGKYQRGELINGSRNARRHVQYPLAHIIQDTSNGASLSGRIKALLNS